MPDRRFAVDDAPGPDYHLADEAANRHTWDNSIEPACTVEPGSGVRFDCRDAYVLCSVTIDLNISEIVDAPNWT